MDAMRMSVSANRVSPTPQTRVESPRTGGDYNQNSTKVPSYEGELKNVVSTSRDGDTVQVNPTTEEARKRREDGRITEKDQSGAQKAIEERRLAEERRRKAAIEEAKAKEERKQALKDQAPTSYAGKTVSDIENMYRQGIISRSEYEKQKSIKEETNQEAVNSANDFTKKTAKLNGTLTKAQLDQMAIEGAYGKNSNKGPIEAKARMAAMDRITNNNNRQQARIAAEGKRTWDYQLQA